MVGTDPRHVGRAQVMRGRVSQAKFSGILEEKRRGGGEAGKGGEGKGWKEKGEEKRRRGQSFKSSK